jgi:hypothetical protein
MRWNGNRCQISIIMILKYEIIGDKELFQDISKKAEKRNMFCNSN